MKNLFLILLTFFSAFGHADSEKISLFNYETAWLDQNDKSRQLKDFKGQTYLISMAYTGCTHTCPLIISKIEEIKKLLSEKGHKDVKVVLASFDDVTDKPRQLKSYMKKRGLDEGTWTLLSPKSQKEVRELAVILGVSFKKLKNGDFSHANVIGLVDGEGHLIAKLDNLSGDVQVFQEALRKR